MPVPNRIAARLLLRTRACLLWGCAILASGCAPGSFYVEPADGEPANLFQSSRVFSDEAGPVNVVIRSPADWEDFLATYPTRNADYARDRFWRVDYTRHMVVGVVLGRRWSGSISVHIDSLHVDGRRLLVHATEHRPTYATRDFGNPAHFVVTDRTHLPVEFADVEVAAD